MKLKNFFCQFPNPWALRVSGMDGIPQNMKKSQNHCTLMCSCEFIHTNDMHFTTKDFSPLSFMLNSIRGNCVLAKVAHCDTAWKKSTKYGENPLKKKGRVGPETLLYVTKDGVNETFLTLGLM
jgi:hypothetical protein